ncbi:MAG: hypothetical protein Q8Q38_02090 [bacterium]|nr:hypothetical protein [bacterium]
MNIMIIGSMSFAEKMFQVKEELEKLGHSAEVPFDAEYHVNDGNAIDDLERNLQYCIENDVIWKGFEQVANADAVLALNYEKNGIEGYVGTSTLMEMAIAHWHRKPIFLLYEPPDHKIHRWAHEVRIMHTDVLHGDLTKLGKGRI